LEWAFWIVFGLICFPFVAYPAILYLLGVFRRESDYPQLTEFPFVSVLFAARNEEDCIAQRIENLLSLDYPADRMEILVASDASTDRTDEIVRGYEDRNVKLFRSDNRQGKSALIDMLTSEAAGEILVCTDANTSFQPETIRELVRPFSDPAVGCVDGSKKNSLSGDSCESIYWRFEKSLKRLGSRLGAVLGATGAVFAVRKSLHDPITPKRGDDFETAVIVRIKGYKCVFNDRAVAYEPAPDDRSQYHRLVRIVSWMSGSAWMLLGRALSRGKLLLSFQLLVHKILRWQTGFLTLAATILLVFLAGNPLYLVILCLFLLFHLLAVAGRFMKNVLPASLLLPYYFWLMNSASMAGTMRFLLFKPSASWDLSAR
jgi:cellulose synthase/poly-beta-1,6-N-acetylglucosamine synthase-like glycosyltransferase